MYSNIYTSDMQISYNAADKNQRDIIIFSLGVVKQLVAVKPANLWLKAGLICLVFAAKERVSWDQRNRVQHTPATGKHWCSAMRCTATLVQCNALCSNKLVQCTALSSNNKHISDKLVF